MFPSWEAGNGSSTSVPVPLIVTPVTPLTSSKSSEISNEAAPSVTATSSSATATSTSAPTTEARTTVITVAAPTSHPALSTTTTRSSDYVATPAIPTIASGPYTTNSTDKTSSALATRLGIGLGIPLLVLLVVAVTACIYRRQKRRPYTDSQPLNPTAPELPRVGEADIACRGEASRQYHHGRPGNTLWSAWGTAGAGDGGPYDDNQLGYVSPLEFQGYYQGYQLPWEGYGVDSGSPTWYQHPYQYRSQEHQDQGGTVEISSPYDNQGHVSQVPVVQFQQPDQARQEGQRHSVQVGSGPNSGIGEVSPLSSSGSGPPFPRVSIMSGLGRTDK